MRRIGLHELVRQRLGAIRGAIVDDDKLPVDVAGGGPPRQYSIQQFLGESRDVVQLEQQPYFWVNVRFRSQVMMGRFWRSLKVGRITEYKSLPDDFFAGAIVRFKED